MLIRVNFGKIFTNSEMFTLGKIHTVFTNSEKFILGKIFTNFEKFTLGKIFTNSEKFTSDVHLLWEVYLREYGHQLWEVYLFEDVHQLWQVSLRCSGALRRYFQYWVRHLRFTFGKMFSVLSLPTLTGVVELVLVLSSSAPNLSRSEASRPTFTSLEAVS